MQNDGGIKENKGFERAEHGLAGRKQQNKSGDCRKEGITWQRKKDCIFNRADDCRALKMKYCKWEEKECKFYKNCKTYNETGMSKTRNE